MPNDTEYDIYMRGEAIISLRIQGRPPAGFSLDAVKRKITDTLDAIPLAHINLFGRSGYIRLGTVPNTGGGHNPHVPYIRLSYDCFNGTHSYNNNRLSYTLLHEMGHIVDKSESPSCMAVLKRNYPLGCLAIITRYHGGATRGFSEHYADIYADYFYHEVGGLTYRVNRRDRRINPNDSGATCGGGCTECSNWLRQRLAISRRLPTSRQDLTALRYNALFRSAPFLSIERGRVYRPVTFNETINEVYNDFCGVRGHEENSCRDLQTLPIGRVPSLVEL